MLALKMEEGSHKLRKAEHHSSIRSQERQRVFFPLSIQKKLCLDFRHLVSRTVRS
jgi:hypothetical protein